jgi:hypothetical protein
MKVMGCTNCSENKGKISNLPVGTSPKMDVSKAYTTSNSIPMKMEYVGGAKDNTGKYRV